MATTQPGGPGRPHEQVFGPEATDDVPGSTAGPPEQRPFVPAPAGRNNGMAIAVVVSIVLATAALVVGVLALTRSPGSTAPSTSVSSKSATSAPTDTTAANRALCTAIAPLMTEDNKVAKTLSNLGPPASPGWDAGKDKFVSDTKDWVGRIQPVIDSHADADPYLRRSLQRFVDDQRYLVADLEAGPWQTYDQTIWNDGLAAGSGPLSICWDLGVKW